MGNFYDGYRVHHSFGVFDFGGGASDIFAIVGPKGRGAYLVNYGVEGVIEAFAGSTSTPMMSVGTVADPDAYGEEFDFGTLAADSGKSIRSTYPDYSASIATYIVDPSIPKDTTVAVTCVVAVGTPTGQAVPFVDLIWDW